MQLRYSPHHPASQGLMKLYSLLVQSNIPTTFVLDPRDFWRGPAVRSVISNGAARVRWVRGVGGGNGETGPLNGDIWVTSY